MQRGLRHLYPHAEKVEVQNIRRLVDRFEGEVGGRNKEGARGLSLVKIFFLF
jgi:hypothetical protein